MIAFLLGLNLWVKAYCSLLVAAFLSAVVYASMEASKIGKWTATLRKALQDPGGATPHEQVYGRDLEAVERIRGHAVAQPPAPREWWYRIDETIAEYSSPRRKDSDKPACFLTASASEVLTEDTVIYRHYNAGFHSSVPGLLTSLGLLGTFIAILVGLSGLKPDGEMIKGVPDLVASLSGKFTTSVIALFLSAAYTVFESAWLQSYLRRKRGELVGALQDAIPLLSTSRLLLDMQAEAAKQTVSLSNISSEVVYKFADIFRTDISPMFARGVSDGVALELSQSLTPTLESLNTTLGMVGETVKNLEQGKQESVVGELRGLTTALQESLRRSLAEMGEQFRSSLSGTAKDEFGGVAQTLRESAGLLGNMNTAFESMQAILNTLINQSRQTTTEQLAQSAEQTTRLTALVEGLLVRLNDSANQSASQVNTVLTSVVADLSEKVSNLSKQLVQEVSAAAARSQETAAAGMRSASEWSIRSSEQLSTLIETLQSKATDFERAGQTLMAAQVVLEKNTRESAAGLAAMQEAAKQVSTYSGSLAGLQQALREESAQQRQLSASTKLTVERLAELSTHHNELLAQYDAVFRRSEEVFGGLDDRLRRVLETILEKVQQYNQGVERNFSALVGHVNNTMPQMGEVLAGAAVELREQVDELTEVLQTRLPQMKS